jgi:hypothetical protein
MRYANWPGLVALSGPTRLVTAGAHNFEQGIAAAADFPHFAAIRSALRGGKIFAPLIAVEDCDDRSLILIEGHSRATVYALERYYANVEVLVGRSPWMREWWLY